jgi:pimeloyl-ACP methyl ester carboxylesterase
VSKRKRGPLFWIGRTVLILVALLVAAAAAGTAYQAIATSRDHRDFPPPGELVDVGGYMLHIQCAGDVHAGMATVILEAGTGLSSPAWTLIQSPLAETTRVCAYDRAGNGWSEPGPLPRDARRIADELHTLLLRAEIAGPYVLVGHSFGGMYVRVYAAAYPGDVVGLVLVDSSHPDQLMRSPSRSAELEGFKKILRIAPLLANLGIVRLGHLGESETFDLPGRQRQELTAFAATPEQASTVLAELEGFPATTDLLHAAPPLGDLPLYVLTAGKEADTDWPALQDELATLSSNSVHRVVAANHNTLLFGHDGAEAVGAAVRAVLDAVRTGQRLDQ